VRGGDIDVLITDIQDASEICSNKGLSIPSSKMSSRLSILAEKGIKNPYKSISLARRSPKKVMEILNSAIKRESRDFLAPEYQELKPQTEDVTFHLFNHLAHTSPIRASKVRLDPEVERMMLDDRIKTGAIYRPSPPDELAHLLARGVFDYGGRFPDYYIQRCESLTNEVIENEEYKEKFHKLLSLIWFEAGELVFEMCKNKQYDKMKSELDAYSGY